MPLTKSAAKQMRIARTRHARLVPYKTRMKTMLRTLQDVARTGDLDRAKALLPRIYSAIDVACKKGIIHQNTAARRKARSASLLACAKQGGGQMS